MDTDSQILIDLRHGKLDTLYNNMYPGLLSYATHILGTEYAFLAEDCVQEAILQAYQQRASFESAFFFKAYLYTCIRNRAVSILRKSHAQETYLAEQDEAGTDLVNDFIREEVLNQLYNAIRELPAEHRRLFELSYEQGLKNAEVAAILQVSESTVTRRKAQTVELLRAALRRNGCYDLLLLLGYLLGE